jgi:ABC-type phosphate transport system ATPase subunit
MKNTQTPEIAIETKNLFIFYGSFAAVSEVNMKIEKQKIIA